MRFANIKRQVMTCVLVSAMLPAVPAMAAFDTYMTINGTKQGQFKGERMSEKIAVTSVSHDARMASGMTTGRRQHGAITIRREIDAASPKLFQALSTNESLNDVTIVFHTTGGGAGKVQTINLKNARITAVRKAGGSELITMEYDTIEVTWTDGGKTASDDWEAPN